MMAYLEVGGGGGDDVVPKSNIRDSSASASHYIHPKESHVASRDIWRYQTSTFKLKMSLKLYLVFFTNTCHS
jgi:hypothetical protein